jgi:hypothetical protein
MLARDGLDGVGGGRRQNRSGLNATSPSDWFVW